MPDTELPPAPPMHEPLSVIERRILGVLVEKNKTTKTPDTYPMTLNSVVLGCNQKSNRDPVLELDEDEVEETLNDLMKKGLTIKQQGGRADRWRHLLYDAWNPSKVELAILAELLLRGPQSEGDLRGRASRMDEIADLDTLRGLLKGLCARNLTVYLSPPGRGAMVTHGFHTPEELAAIRGGQVPVAGTAAPRAPSHLEAQLAEALAEIAKLKDRVAALEAR
jgi:uncharacterized protein YceH (UPF0502 family)